MIAPKPYVNNIKCVKAFVLGCDPTAFDKAERKKPVVERKPIAFDFVFDLNNGLKYFREIDKNLNALNLSRRYVYVQNLVADYQDDETSKNKEWIKKAQTYIEARKSEFDKIDPTGKLPVFLTSEILCRALINEKRALLKPKEYYSGERSCFIAPEDNKLERALIPLFRHSKYAIKNHSAFKNKVLNHFNFNKFSSGDTYVQNYYRSKAKKSFATKLELYVFNKILVSSSRVFSFEDFLEFQINDDLVKKYICEFKQFENDYEIDNFPIYYIYQELIKMKKLNCIEFGNWCKSYISEIFPENFKLTDFVNLRNSGKCHYCGITEEGIDLLADKLRIYKKANRGWALEIDRKNSNFEYTKNNCVLSCYWCNNAKTDEFSHKEFREIGKAIKQVWDKRLSN